MRQSIAAGLAAGFVSTFAISPAGAQALPELPAALKPAGLLAYLEVPATGVQIYVCGKNDAGAWTWVFKAPEAELFDTQKKQIGKHYAGPTWEALAGGKVVGAVKASAPAPEAGSIAWLLLDIKSNEGAGVFNQAKGVLRVSTHGGVAPAQGCDEAHAGQESRVPYTATYFFLK
jgi:Protein of unknown function (DUF3455)